MLGIYKISSDFGWVLIFEISHDWLKYHFSPRKTNLIVFIILRAGELSAAELDNLMTIVANPRQFKIPDWFLNRQKDYKDGKYSQVVSNALDMKLRDDLECLKKIR